MMQNNRIPPQNIFINLVELNQQGSIKTSFGPVIPLFVITFFLSFPDVLTGNTY